MTKVIRESGGGVMEYGMIDQGDRVLRELGLRRSAQLDRDDS